MNIFVLYWTIDPKEQENTERNEMTCTSIPQNIKLWSIMLETGPQRMRLRVTERYVSLKFSEFVGESQWEIKWEENRRKRKYCTDIK
jgi:hypothetical protein